MDAQLIRTDAGPTGSYKLTLTTLKFYPFKVPFLWRHHFQSFFNPCKKYFHAKIELFVSKYVKMYYQLLISGRIRGTCCFL